MRFSTIFFTLFTASPALAHGTHLLPAGGHNHGAGLTALALAAAGIAAWLANRTCTPRTGKDG